jgi:hypothetical protein
VTLSKSQIAVVCSKISQLKINQSKKEVMSESEERANAVSSKSIKSLLQAI